MISVNLTGSTQALQESSPRPSQQHEPTYPLYSPGGCLPGNGSLRLLEKTPHPFPLLGADNRDKVWLEGGCEKHSQAAAANSPKGSQSSQAFPKHHHHSYQSCLPGHWKRLLVLILILSSGQDVRQPGSAQQVLEARLSLTCCSAGSAQRNKKSSGDKHCLSRCIRVPAPL